MMPQRLMWISVCLATAVTTTAAAQERLSLEDATARALTKNHAIRIECERVAAAGARETSALGEYDPQFRLAIDAGHHKDPITSLFSGAPAGQVAPTQNDFGWSASISQLFKSGAVATVTSSTSRESTNSAFTLVQPAYLTSLGVDLRQPLLRNRAIDPARTALRVTALDRDRSSAVLALQVLQTVSEVERAYWGLVAAHRDLETRRNTLALAEAQRRDTEVRIEARTIAASDLAQPTAEVERRRGDLFAAQETVARSERALKQLMLGDASDPGWAIDITPADQPDIAPRVVDLTAALNDAYAQRPELRDLAARLEQGDAAVALAQDGLKPRLDLVA